MHDENIGRAQKFDVEPRFRVPDLDAVVPAGSATIRVAEHLRSDYYDTADADLRSAGMALRRRIGDAHAGWQLTVPHGGHREGLPAEMSDVVPADVDRLLLGVTRGRSLAPIATLETERHVTRLIDADGVHLADIGVDQVTAATEAGTASTWTELEIALGDSTVPEQLLSDLGAVLRDAGAKRTGAASELDRALGLGSDRSTRRKKSGRSSRKRKVSLSSGVALQAYLVVQQRALLAGDVQLRRGDYSVIHATRVATRRVRSVLRVFAPLFDRERANQLDDGLRWYAELLGAVRDTDIRQLRLAEAIGHLPAELTVGALQQRVDGRLRAIRTRAARVLQEQLTESRYLGLLADIDEWTDAPPLTGRANKGVTDLVRLIRRAEREVGRRLRRAAATGDVELLHGARKSAKRARYAAEATIAAFGWPAASEDDRYRRLQDLLGEHQDSVMTARFIRTLGADLRDLGIESFALGVLFQREEDRGLAARRKATRIASHYR